MKKRVCATLAMMLLLTVMFFSNLQTAFTTVFSSTPSATYYNFTIYTRATRYSPEYSIGHAFIQYWTTSDLITKKDQVYGFYPSAGKKIQVLYGPGYLQYDGYHEWDWKIAFNIPQEKYDHLRQWVNSQNPGQENPEFKYSLPLMNCMMWTIKAAEEVGIYFPPLFYTFGGIPDPWIFAKSLKVIGNGGTWNGGVVYKYDGKSPAEDPPLHVGSYSLTVDWGLDDPDGLASYLGVPLTTEHLPSQSVYVGETVTFASPSLHPDSIFYWDFGDGGYNIQAQTTTHSYSSQGYYIARFLAINDWGVWLYEIHIDVHQYGGGFFIPINKIELLAPYIGLVSAIAVATTATAICVKRVKRRREKR